MFLLGLGSWINIYWSNKYNHQVTQGQTEQYIGNTINSEVFQKVFVGSEFWVLLILIINLGCYMQPLRSSMAAADDVLG